jgi:hypothetical protein
VDYYYYCMDWIALDWTGVGRYIYSNSLFSVLLSTYLLHGSAKSVTLSFFFQENTAAFSPQVSTVLHISQRRLVVMG